MRLAASFNRMRGVGPKSNFNNLRLAQGVHADGKRPGRATVFFLYMHHAPAELFDVMKEFFLAVV